MERQCCCRKNLKKCGKLKVTKGHNPGKTRHGKTVVIRCKGNREALPPAVTCIGGEWSVPKVICRKITPFVANTCIILIGGPAHRPEYYHPSEGKECDLDKSGTIAEQNTNVSLTTGCYLPATWQVVLRENTHYALQNPMLFGLSDTSVRELPLPSARRVIRGSTSASLGSSGCLSCGGKDENDAHVEDCYQFNPFLDALKWTPIPKLPKAKYQAASVSLTATDFYLIGGEPTSRDLLHYNALTNAWTAKAPMIAGRHGSPGAAPLSSSEFIVCGGLDDNGFLASCEVYNATADTWRSVGRMNAARSFFAMVSFEGDIYALGGMGLGAVSSIDTVEKYDRIEESWAMVKGLNGPRVGHVAVAV